MTGKCKSGKCPNKGWKGFQGYCEKHAYGLGKLHHMSPAEDARKLITKYRNAGHTSTSISMGTGIPQSVIADIENGVRKWTKKHNMDRLKRFDGKLTKHPAWPLQRRIQALRAAGAKMEELSEGMGLHSETIMHLCNGQAEQARPETDRVIREYYRVHEMDPVRPAHWRTARNRWSLPFDWVDIDDPQERRGLLTAEQRSDRVPVTETLADAALFLHDTHNRNCDLAGATAGVHGPTLINVMRMTNQTVASEIAHRITYRAECSGWVSQVSEVAA